MRLLPFVLITASIAGCAQLPDVPEPARGSGEEPVYPTLIPLGDITGDSAAQQQADLRAEQTVALRVAGLKARANQLRGFSFD